MQNPFVDPVENVSANVADLLEVVYAPGSAVITKNVAVKYVLFFTAGTLIIDEDSAEDESHRLAASSDRSTPLAYFGTFQGVTISFDGNNLEFIFGDLILMIDDSKNLLSNVRIV